MISDSIDFIQRHYPEMKIKSYDNFIVFEGRFIINAKYNYVEINRAPKLAIIVPKSYPQNLPKVFELENKIVNEHKLDDGSLCVATFFDLFLELSHSKTIEDYINKFLIPYFISYEQWCITGEYIYGDRSHGSKGIYESISEYFSNGELDKNEIKDLLKWAAKKQKFSQIYRYKNKFKIKKKYNNKIANLRTGGILNLRKVYKQIDSIEKMYFQYKKLENLYRK